MQPVQRPVSGPPNFLPLAALHHPALPPPTPWQRLVRLLDTERDTIRYIFFYAIASGLISLSLPLGTQAVFNLVSVGAVFGSTYLLIGAVVLGVVLGGALLVGQLTLVESMEQRLFAKAAIEYAYRLPRIAPAALAGHHPPELVNRFFDILTVQKGITKLLIDLMFAGFQILFGVVVLTLYHPVFIALGVVTVLALVLGYWLHYRQALRTSIAESAGKYALVAWLQQVASELPAYRHHPARLAQATDRADALTAGYLRERNGHFRVLRRYFTYAVGLRTALTGALLVAGTLFVVSRQMSLGQFVAAEVIILQISNSIEKLTTGVNTVFDMLTGVEKLAAVTDLPLSPALAPAAEAHP